MLSPRYAAKKVKEIASSIDFHLPIHETYDEYTETTHLSTMDKNMAVSLTQSIERVYGSKAAAEGLGFLYNNYLMDFEYHEPKHPYYLRPNSVPWATVSPSIVFKDEKPWLVMGSPGSERIFSVLTQFLMHIVDENMSIDKAIVEPRIHSSLGGKVSYEDRFDKEIIEYLKREGYRLDKREPFSFYLGSIHAILRKRDGGFQGVADVRRDGTAGGL